MDKLSEDMIKLLYERISKLLDDTSDTMERAGAPDNEIMAVLLTPLIGSSVTGLKRIGMTEADAVECFRHSYREHDKMVKKVSLRLKH